MPLPPTNPPLINSANPWATTEQDLETLFNCEHTGAVTTRTSLIHGFEHDDSIHQYTFFDPHNHSTPASDTQDANIPNNFNGSLNTLGYSPLPLEAYLATILKITTASPSPTLRTKPFIISVTGSVSSVSECYRLISTAQAAISNPLCMEINLSCPNIPHKPPPAYSKVALLEYVNALARERDSDNAGAKVAIGVKIPPYTYHDQFQILIDALLETRCEVDFITATNTLGSSLVLSNDGNGKPAINSSSGLGIGGMAGAPLHPLALGNVKTIRAMLDQHERLRGVDVIGVGGVSDGAGFERMRAVGAGVVGVGTALGREGVGIFGKILGVAGWAG